MIPVIFAVAGAIVMFAWMELTHRFAEKRSHQELCRHQWSDTWEVGKPTHFGPSGGQRFWIQDCPACGKQKHVNEDGSKYIPRSERRDDGE